jgi:hypothetical protein
MPSARSSGRQSIVHEGSTLAFAKAQARKLLDLPE